METNEMANISIAQHESSTTQVVTARWPIVACITQNDPRAAARDEIGDTQLELAGWDATGEQQMFVKIHALLAYIDQREFITIAQHRLDRLR